MQQNKELFIPALKKIMTDFKIKTPAMAKEAGLSEADGKNLASYISGKRTFPIKKLEQIFVAFGVNIEVEKPERNIYTDEENKRTPSLIADAMPYFNPNVFVKNAEVKI